MKDERDHVSVIKFKFTGTTTSVTCSRLCFASGLVNDTVNSSENTAPNDRMIN
jgi:hypothetical protein